jgi:hypothetical protein
MDMKYPFLAFLIAMSIIYFTMGTWYKNKYGLYRSRTDSINNLLTIRRQQLQTTIADLKPIHDSVSAKLKAKQGVYSQITDDRRALVNWRPLSVRLAGYLGGDTLALNGVFDMPVGIHLALDRGVRCFVFDIDYLDERPCEPCLIHRDDWGVMRSLHTGSIRDAMSELAKKAFVNNYDPVMIIIYFRRIPAGKNQEKTFFKSVAAAMSPISAYHLGSTEQGNFHNCRSEKILFTSDITSFQTKFIVLCNYNTNLLPRTPNPKDNLDFWVNARLYQDPNGASATLGPVSCSVPSGQIAYARVGSTDQLLNIPETSVLTCKTGNSNTFTVALSSIDTILTTAHLSTLLNKLGVQCVPIDVLRLACKPEYIKTLNAQDAPANLSDLSNAINPPDPLSFWKYAGWSRKLIIDGFQDVPRVPVAAAIPGFIIPSPVVPKKPPPSTNSNGGLVSISG